MILLFRELRFKIFGNFKELIKIFKNKVLGCFRLFFSVNVLYIRGIKFIMGFTEIKFVVE